MRNNFLIHGRKGDKIISVYWFAILFIVAAAISYMVVSFYGEPYDVRSLEANALTNHVARCLVQGGYLEENVLGEEFKQNFLENCNLNFEVEDSYGWRKQEQYYVEIGFYDFESDVKINEIKEGNSGIKTECGREGRGFPFCLDRNFYVIDKDNNQYKINILSVVRKTEKNAQ